jgi:hypothetical protein
LSGGTGESTVGLPSDAEEQVTGRDAKLRNNTTLFFCVRGLLFERILVNDEWIPCT